MHPGAGAADAQGAVKAAGAQAEAVDGGHEDAAGGRGDLAVGGHLGRREVAVLGALASPLAGSGGQHPGPDLGGRSASAAPVSSSAVSRSAWTYRSMRSSRGPESRLAYRCRSYRLQRQANRLSPRCPQGQGLAAATRANRAGKRTEVMARETVTSPSSRGWRSASQAARENSGSSSRNRTPWLARVQECS